MNDKELLLKDLSGRLPYHVKYHYIDVNNNDRIDTLKSVILHRDKNELIFMVCGDYSVFHTQDDPLVKPYLFPLSSMTEEQLKEMQEIIGNPNEACISVNTSGLELWLNSVDTDPTIWLDTVFELQDWLNKNNFDTRGLIEKSLALDATNLNIY